MKQLKLVSWDHITTCWKNREVIARCYEVRIEESKKVGSCHELNPAVPIEDCEGWGLPGSHSSVAELWQLKPGVLEGPFFVYTEGKSE